MHVLRNASWLLAAAVTLAGCEETGEKTADNGDGPAEERAGNEEKDDSDAEETSDDEGGLREQLEARGKAILTALKEKNVDKLATFVPKKVRPELKKELGKGGREHDDYFEAGNWEHDGIQAWNGEIGEIRVKDGEKAYLVFGEKGGDELLVLRLKKKGDTWWFHRIASPTQEQLEGRGEAVE